MTAKSQDESNQQTTATATEQTETRGVKALIGRKLGMSQIFTEDGAAKAVTLVEAGPCVITAIKTEAHDGYDALQIGFEEKKDLNKAESGHAKKSKSSPRYLREIRGQYEVKLGDQISVAEFETGDMLNVTGTSKGKGFTGTIKRHNFSRGPMSHGSRNKRRSGSIGSMYPQKVFKGKKMAGHMGDERVTVKNISVAAVDAEHNLIALSGAVPGKRGSLLVLKERTR